MHNDLSLIPDFKCCLIAAGIFVSHEHVLLLILKDVFGIHQPLALLIHFSLWARHVIIVQAFHAEYYL